MTALLELGGITRRFGAVLANDNVDFAVSKGEIHALVGENGAGKSTLMHIAFGLVRADAGTIRIGGKPMPKRYTPQVAMSRRVGMVHQHFMLAEDMTVAENIMLGREPLRAGLLDTERASTKIRDVAKKLGVEVNPEAVVADLSVGEKQRVEILKAMWRGCDVLILDEPTAVLTPGEVSAFFDSLRTLAAADMAIVIITHKLDEVFEIADRITVMRRGAKVATVNASASTPEAIAELMVGRSVLLKVDKSPTTPAAVVLDVKEARVGRRRGPVALAGVSLTVRAGEIVGIAGVEGNGQSELVAAICGLGTLESGSVSLNRRDITTASVAQRRAAGLALVPEDRHERGLVLDFSITENLILGRTDEFAGRVGIDWARASDFADKEIADHDIRPTDRETIARSLSGGNQQKVVIARELGRGGLSLLVASQPTRGVDIGAIERIHKQLVAARDAGLAILLLSAELSELLALSDRILVMRRGTVCAELDAVEIAHPNARARIGAVMTGASVGDEEE